MNKTVSPLVSILVPVYGVESFIEKCARSLFEQTFENIEYIFVDDSTPDGSIGVLNEILKEYPHRQHQTRIIHHEKNTGIAGVRNTLLDNAQGDYLIFVDSDDWVEVNMVEELYNYASKNDLDILGCDYYLNFLDKPEEYHHENYSKDKIENLRRIISVEIKTFLVKLFVKRSLYESNAIRATLGINVTEDYILYVKLFFYASTIDFLPVAFYHYIQYNPSCYSTLTAQNIEDRIQSVQVVEKFCIQQGIINQVQEEINGRKFIIKTRFILDDNYRDYHRWATTFPESNYAWRQFNFRTDYKIIYWLAEHHAFILVNVVKSLKRLFKK